MFDPSVVFEPNTSHWTARRPEQESALVGIGQTPKEALAHLQTQESDPAHKRRQTQARILRGFSHVLSHISTLILTAVVTVAIGFMAYHAAQAYLASHHHTPAHHHHRRHSR